jgi:hypothetical protein
MQRHGLGIIFILLILMLLTSCSPSFETANISVNENSLATMDIDEFLINTKLPLNFIISMDEKILDTSDSAATYHAITLTFNKAQLAELLIKSTKTEEIVYAEGPQIHGLDHDVLEYLNLYDNGVMFQSKGKNEGAIEWFIYRYYSGNGLNNYLPMIASPSLGLADKFAQLYQYNRNSDYGSKSDLSFKSYSETQSDLIRLFTKIGLPNIKVDEAYSLDLETMQAHYDLYVKANPGDTYNPSLTIKDECYLMSFRQFISDIPVVNIGWMNLDNSSDLSATGNYMPATIIQTIYSNQGIVQATVQHAYKIVEEIEQKKLINLPIAMQVLIDEFSQVILLDEVKLISAELCYISIPDSEQADQFELRPAWIFCLSKSVQEEDGVYNTYRYDVVDAITSKLFKGRW